MPPTQLVIGKVCEQIWLNPDSDLLSNSLLISETTICNKQYFIFIFVIWIVPQIYKEYGPEIRAKLSVDASCRGFIGLTLKEGKFT